jgi:hypothetical protein
MMANRVMLGARSRDRLVVYVCSAQPYPPHGRAYGWCEVRLSARMPRSTRRTLIAWTLRCCRGAYLRQIALG